MLGTHHRKRDTDKTNNGVFDEKILLFILNKLKEKVIYKCKFKPLTVELLQEKMVYYGLP